MHEARLRGTGALGFLVRQQQSADDQAAQQERSAIQSDVQNQEFTIQQDEKK